MIRVSGLQVRPGQGEMDALRLALKVLKLGREDILSFQVSKKSVDARDKGAILLVYTLDLEVRENEEALAGRLASSRVSIAPRPQRLSYPRLAGKRRPYVAGLGPCGLFAAYYLAKAGLRPIVLERGLPVAERGRSVNALMREGILDPESNFQFGEGGAGAFSDGKLTTGIKDPLVREVLSILVEHGAPEELLYLQRPHIGTDRLPQVVSAMRSHIEALGGTVLFSARLEGLLLDKGRLYGVKYVSNGQVAEVDCRELILAIGHSARDTQARLHGQGMALSPKPFSIGLRIEHSQRLINRAQYGAMAESGLLPSAEYHLAHRLKDGRGAYTFCMCPGGRVLPAASEDGGVCVNGMSNFKRDGRNANAAVLVEVRPEDYMSGGNPLSGFSYQRRFEALAYGLGGGGFKAPYQLVGDFLQGTVSSGFGSVLPSYKPGLRSADLASALPGFAAHGIREAIQAFDRKLKGFAARDAVLTGIETRSSCPVQAKRDGRYESNLRGVYPAGEGAGRAGGIMSSAVDGLKAAMALAEGMKERERAAEAL